MTYPSWAKKLHYNATLAEYGQARSLELTAKESQEVWAEFNRLSQLVEDLKPCWCGHIKKSHIFDVVIRQRFCSECPGERDLHEFDKQVAE